MATVPGVQTKTTPSPVLSHTQTHTRTHTPPSEGVSHSGGTRPEDVLRPLPFQVPHIANLERILKTNAVGLDCSSTGCGKTFTALFVALLLGLCVFVVCPKSVVPSWSDAARGVGMRGSRLLGIASYESLKRGKGYFAAEPGGDVDWRAGTRACPFAWFEDEPRPVSEIGRAHV